MQVASRQSVWDGKSGTGTVLVLRASTAPVLARIAGGDICCDSAGVTVDWGDGSVERYGSFRDVTHVYSRARDYTVKISDDLASFAYTSSEYGGSDQRDMLVELVRVGNSVRTIERYAFNNCHCMRGVVELPKVTGIGEYAFGSTLGITAFILPAMTSLKQTSFYTCPSATRMYADSVTSIDGNFWTFYGSRLAEVYIRKMSCQQIKSMRGFPFAAHSAVCFHGSDGIVRASGQIELHQ